MFYLQLSVIAQLQYLRFIKSDKIGKVHVSLILTQAARVQFPGREGGFLGLLPTDIYIYKLYDMWIKVCYKAVVAGLQ